MFGGQHNQKVLPCSHNPTSTVRNHPRRVALKLPHCHEAVTLPVKLRVCQNYGAMEPLASNDIPNLAASLATSIVLSGKTISSFAPA